ncbi:MAG: histidine kinase N-terminal 7TM domain-containing protein [Chloroflexota bacterium]|nr:histidine kinase N-terminal 7TM domain-containing protein [Chloroflexota bacterium]
MITTFSLVVYIFTHNLRSSVARAFCALLTFVLVVYTGDVVLYNVASLDAAVVWLKFQWLGIAFVPAAYLHFSDALLRTTNAFSQLRRVAVHLGYLSSVALLLLVAFTDLVVHDGIYMPQFSHLRAGPLFWVFTMYFLITVAWGARNIHQARRRCLTSTSRRRMTYLAMAFAAPALGVFPYLLVSSRPTLLPLSFFLLLLLAGNVGVALMMVVMAYSVAYFGVLTPDRVVKHSLIHYLLRGPFVATCVLILILALGNVESFLGLPHDAIVVFGVVVLIVLLQILINQAKPFIDRLIYRQDRAEITWIQELDKRLLTSTDLAQFLEGVLTSMCELLRVRSSFVAAVDGDQLVVEASCGFPDAVGLLSNLDPRIFVHLTGRGEQNGDEDDKKSIGDQIVAQDDYWIIPLQTRARDTTLGLLAVEAHSPQFDLDAEGTEAISSLVRQAEAALEDRSLQQGVFAALQLIIPEIERIQRRRGTVRYEGSPAWFSAEEGDLVSKEDFSRLVKDALSHYWGGPKLTQSPLLKLRVVEAARQQEGSSTMALRAVLARAIEHLRPEGQRSMTTTDWILYNILDLKFLQGRRVSEVAARLAC